MTDSVDGNIDLFNFMKNLEFFNKLNKKSLWPLTNLANMLHFKAGELLIVEDSGPIGLFILKSGKAKVYKTAKDGSELFIAELLPGELIGEISIFEKLKTTASVVALEDLDCIFISEKDFTAQLQAYPEIGMELLTVLAKSYITKIKTAVK